MSTYIVGRLLRGALVLLLVSLSLFSLLRSLPGDTVLTQLAQAAALSTEELAVARHELGIDRPFWPQYATWLGRVLQGELGHSLTSQQPVHQDVGKRLTLTLHLVCMALLIAVLLAIPVGLLSAVWPDTVTDYLGRMLAIAGLSCPDFWLATVAVTAMALCCHWMPPPGFAPLWVDPPRCLSQLLLPAVILGARLSAGLMRLTRASLLEVLRADYLRTARAKGLRERLIIMKHGLKNACLPALPLIGQQGSGLLGGVVMVEVIFVLPGVGSLTLDAAMLRDYTMLQGSAMFFAGTMVGMHLLVDISYAYFDPRRRSGSAPESGLARQAAHMSRAEVYRPTVAQTQGQIPGRRLWWRLIRRQPHGAGGAVMLCGLLVIACLAPRLAPYDPDYCHLNTRGLPLRLQAPNTTFLFGTDARGRDVLSRMIYGARIALLVGCSAVALGTVLGSLVGLVSGYWEGILDEGLQCLVDALMALPGMVLALVALSVCGQNLRNVILVLGLVIALGVARVVRSTVLTSQHQAYVEAARAAGASSWRMLIRHRLPPVCAPVLGLAAAWCAQAIVMEAALSVVGFGTPPPTPTWGGIMSGAGRRSVETAPYLALFPGLIMSLVVLALYLCGEALDDLLASRLHTLRAVRTMKG